MKYSIILMYLRGMPLDGRFLDQYAIALLIPIKLSQDWHHDSLKLPTNSSISVTWCKIKIEWLIFVLIDQSYWLSENISQTMFEHTFLSLHSLVFLLTNLSRRLFYIYLLTKKIFWNPSWTCINPDHQTKRIRLNWIWLRLNWIIQ